MANTAAAVVGPEKPKLTLIAVNLPRPVSLAGTPAQHFSSPKYSITQDERGDVRIRDARGNELFVPKQQAILEFSPRG